MNSHYIFIGGSWNGHWLPASPDVAVWNVIPNGFKYSPDASVTPERYIPERIVCNREPNFYFRLEGISQGQAFAEWLLFNPQTVSRESIAQQIRIQRKATPFIQFYELTTGPGFWRFPATRHGWHSFCTVRAMKRFGKQEGEAWRIATRGRIKTPFKAVF